MTQSDILPSSFRDPSGFLFSHEGRLCRQVNQCYQENYRLLLSSGLYDALVEKHLLIPHEQAAASLTISEAAFCVIEPQRVPFISYPYEWCFSQLKDAALATLEIQRIPFEHGMTLKDASAYNIQFLEGKAVFIDTLSFEKYTNGQAWPAYKQFCQHFLAPLALMSLRDIRLEQLLRVYIDGIPLDLAGKLLPLKSRLSLSLLMHIHLHGKSQCRHADSPKKIKQQRIGELAFRGLIDSLESAIKKLTWNAAGTEWADYYNQTNYSEQAAESKNNIIRTFLEHIKPKTTWDLGANTGQYSQIAASVGSDVIAFDIDPAAVEKGYCYIRKTQSKHILPLMLDLCNPSPALGWAHSERMSLLGRANPDAVMALALIHHLALSNNLPLSRIAEFLSQLSAWLIIEFVPKNDSQVQRLLANREDVFPHYNQHDFETEFSGYFEIHKKTPVANTKRTLYLMKRKSSNEY
ncbi:MAG: methyltransferase domain-containing protein [Planctomycetota bacterium]|jgi:hypothetical protein